MAQHIFYRNVRARDQLELFLLSAATSVLLVRFYLFITGYPQIGGGGLHIAHMLWGGLLMMVALAMTLAFHGIRAQRVVALLGGIGFGVFIDELGKFITHDNNYFYQPTIGLIYAVFIILYLTFNFLGRKHGLTSREYQLNALAQLEEAVLQNMDPKEKQRVQLLLEQADQKDPITKHLKELLEKLPIIKQPKPHRIIRWWRTVRKTYATRWDKRDTSWLIRGFFIAEILVFLIGGFVALYANISGSILNLDNPLGEVSEAALGQLASSIVAAGFATWGIVLWPRDRLRAYEQFRRATLVNLFLTQFFTFVRLEFLALPGFFFNIALLGLVALAIKIEQRRLL
jgi:hypothetical protein